MTDKTCNQKDVADEIVIPLRFHFGMHSLVSLYCKFWLESKHKEFELRWMETPATNPVLQHITLIFVSEIWNHIRHLAAESISFLFIIRRKNSRRSRFCLTHHVQSQSYIKKPMNKPVSVKELIYRSWFLFHMISSFSCAVLLATSRVSSLSCNNPVEGRSRLCLTRRYLLTPFAPNRIDWAVSILKVKKMTKFQPVTHVLFDMDGLLLGNIGDWILTIESIESCITPEMITWLQVALVISAW